MTSVDLYRTVRLIRRFEEHAIEFVRSGEIVGGIYPLYAASGLRLARTRMFVRAV
jgi:TPP-dependent pyruvate/acetoin dehydrogenase alpha subunit